MAAAAPAPRRHPPQGGYARGEETRTRIIATALRVFGEQGYDHAATRSIAALAGVNPPALQYYFDSKEGLHRACAQHIIDRVSVILAPALARAQAAVRTNQAGEARQALYALLDALADGLVAVGAETWGRFVARGKADGTGPGMALIQERLGVPVVSATTQLIAVATHRTAHDELTRLRACAILGQVSSFHSNRANTLAVMNWSEIDERRLGLIKAVVREHTQAALRAAIASSPAQRLRTRAVPPRRARPVS
ncbi:MAG TPA: CerR family C-terminal domain-containing protein [Steroidobacteraceae bacterium]|nr:CerR family C-terminal domain-containing protein [Steroidobacteraceae bacterium]